jgi:hypothetical protein
MRRMHIHKPLLTRHRRQRLVLWALAMLTWLAAVLFAGREITVRQLSQRHRRMSLDGLTRMTIELMVVRAAELARRRRRKRNFWRYGRDLTPRHLIRSLVGSRLRRVLKPRDVAARIAILTEVLRNLDAFAQLLAKRMRRGLTRLWPIIAAPSAAPPLATLAAPAPALVDSS